MSGRWMKTGRSLPLFAFVGLVVPIAKQDEKDELFAQIRNLHTAKNLDPSVDKNYSLGSLELGQLITTGCNAAVYEARLKASVNNQSPTQPDLEAAAIEEQEETAEESDISIILEEELDYNQSMSTDQDSDISIIDEEDLSDMSIIDEEDEEALTEMSVILEGSDSDYTAISDDDDDENVDDNFWPEMMINLLPSGTGDVRVGGGDVETSGNFDLAVKMMFNYDVESNAEAVLRAMDKEIVPISTAEDFLQRDIWHNGNHVKKKAWPPHPNIVRMYGLFVDLVPDVPDNVEHYPAALPSRIHPNGMGRNMTLFLVMKKYSCTLTDYLTKESPSIKTRCALLCQLLEGVAFLRQQGVAHRDIKSDNLLLDLTTGTDFPQLVISDFGCCLNEGSLKIPFVTRETNRGGNSALMAPEIACAVAGQRSVLDYSKSDLWAVGALAYEIMGSQNPFYRSKTQSTRLDSRTYREEDLPALPDEVPDVVKKLTQNLLSRDPTKRVSAAVAATIVQLHLWGLPGVPGTAGIGAVQNWTVSVAAHAALGRLCSHKNSTVADNIKKIFLSRVLYEDLNEALLFMQTA